MTAAIVSKQALKVKKVLPKAQSKYKKAAIIVPLNGKDEFLGLNEGVDESALKEGVIYEFEISVSKTGKRYVNKVLGEVSGASDTSHSTTAVDSTPTSSLDRDTQITLMNVGKVAGSLAAGDVEAFDKVFDHVKAKYQKEGIL